MKRLPLLLLVPTLLAISSVHAQEGDVEYVRHDLHDVGVSFEAPSMWHVEVNEGDINTVQFFDGDALLFEIAFLPRDLPDEFLVLDDTRNGIASALSSHIVLGLDSVNGLQFHPVEPDRLTHWTVLHFSEGSFGSYVIVEEDGIIWLPFYVRAPVQAGISIQGMYQVLRTIDVDWNLALTGSPVTVEQVHQIAGTVRIPDLSELPANTAVGTRNGRTTEVPIDATAYITWSTLLAPDILNNMVFEIAVDGVEQVITTSMLARDVQPGYYPATFRAREDRFEVERVTGLFMIEAVGDDSLSGQYIAYTNDQILHGHFVDVSLETVRACRRHTPDSSTATLRYDGETFAGLALENMGVSVWLETVTGSSDAQFNLIVEIAPGMTLQLTLSDETAPSGSYSITPTDFIKGDLNEGIIRIDDTEFGIEGTLELTHDEQFSGTFSGRFLRRHGTEWQPEGTLELTVGDAAFPTQVCTPRNP